MKVLVCSFVVSLLGAGIPASIAQSGSGPTNAQTPYTILGTCEDNISALSNAHHLAGEDGTIIVIARLGDGERNRELNSRRLHNVRIYLTEFDWHRPPQTLITAEGEPLKGYGRVELYVRGVLFAVLQVKRNQSNWSSGRKTGMGFVSVAPALNRRDASNDIEALRGIKDCGCCSPTLLHPVWPRL